MDPLTNILLEYSRAEPRASRGGVAALSGFDYQIRTYLADFVASLAVDSELAGAGSAFVNAFEALADHTRSDVGHLVCVQVKTRLTASTMAKAAEEFCRIDAFLARANSPLRVSFELVARTAETVSSWDDVCVPVQAEGALGSNWRALVASRRVLPPRIEPDPWWRLIAAIFPILGDPYGFARRSLDRCLRFGQDPSAAYQVRDSIADDFASSRLRSRLSADLIQRDDLLPFASTSKQVVIGSSPTLDHLRDGAFMPRPEAVADLMTTAERIGVMRSSEPPTNVIDVIWIHGRSGVGKSVLLLQFMQELVLARAARVAWLGRSTNLLVQLLDQVRGTSPNCPGPDYVFVDDLYDPQSRDELSVPALVSQILSSRSVTWPVIVTCGPSEFRQTLERDSRAEGLRLHPWRLAPMKESETATLASWFERRTGHKPTPGPAAKQEEALVLSLIVEMKHGDLLPFAHRFAARLTELGLDDTLRIPLSLNRLYIWTPTSWLSRNDHVRLATLNQEGDVAFLEGKNGHLSYVKLTHPHLADAIYQANTRFNSPRAFALDIVDAFERALADDPPTAARLLQRVAEDHPRLSIVDRTDLVIGFVGAWRKHLESDFPASSQFDPMAWTNWCTWANRDALVSRLTNDFRPLNRAIVALGLSHPHWPRLWTNLWACAPGQVELKRMGKEWVRQNGNLAGWSRVWIALASDATDRNLAITEPSLAEELLGTGYDWLNTHLEAPSWSWVCQELLRHAEHLANITSVDSTIDLVALWLDSNSNSNDWSYVWFALNSFTKVAGNRTDRRRVRVLAESWLQGYPYNPGWPFVFQNLVGAHGPDRQPLVDLGNNWVLDRVHSAEASFVRLAIAENTTSHAVSETAALSVVSWLATHQDDDAWPALWLTLNGICKKNKRMKVIQVRLIAQFLQWVNMDGQSEQLSILWEAAFALAMADPLCPDLDLFRIGLDLVSNLSWPNWKNMFHILNNYLDETFDITMRSSAADVVGQAGMRWLTTPDRWRRAEWDQVFIDCLKHSTGDLDSLLELGLSVVKAHGVLGSRFVTLLLQYARPGVVRERLFEWLITWISRGADGDNSVNTWIRLDALVRDRCITEEDVGWLSLRAVLDENEPPQIEAWSLILESYEEQRPMRGRIKSVVKKRKGYTVDVYGVTAYAPDNRSGASSQLKPGEEAEFVITGVNSRLGHVDLAFLTRRRDCPEVRRK